VVLDLRGEDITFSVASAAFNVASAAFKTKEVDVVKIEDGFQFPSS